MPQAQQPQPRVGVVNDSLLAELTEAIAEAEKLLQRSGQRDNEFYQSARANLEFALESAKQELIQFQTLRHVSATRESDGEAAVMAAFKAA